MNKQTGLTLIEIMISLSLGIIVIGGALSIYISTIRGSTDTINSTSLNHDLDIVMQLITNDVRRSGAWGGAVTSANSMLNPFSQTTTNIQIRNLANPSTVVNTGDCILYSYDGDGDGSVDSNEYYGFRKSGGDIQVRLSGSTNLNCTDGTWRALTDPDKINTTRVTFSLSPISAVVGPPAIPALPATSKCLNVTTLEVFSGPCVNAAAAASGVVGRLPAGDAAAETRQINIILTAEVDNDSVVSKITTATIKVRNNRIFTQ